MSFEEALINEVRSNICLYDLSHPNYKNLILKDNAWRKIAENMDVKEDACRKRWKSLRDSYKRIKQRQQIPSGSGAVEEPHWIHYEAMKFLDAVTSSRPTHGNLDGIEEFCDSPQCDTTPAVTPSPELSIRTRSRQNPELRSFLDTAQASMERLCNAVERQNAQSSGADSTTQLMASLGARILRAGLTENELEEMESAVSSFVFDKIHAIKSKRI